MKNLKLFPLLRTLALLALASTAFAQVTDSVAVSATKPAGALTGVAMQTTAGAAFPDVSFGALTQGTVASSNPFVITFSYENVAAANTVSLALQLDTSVTGYNVTGYTLKYARDGGTAVELPAAGTSVSVVTGLDPDDGTGSVYVNKTTATAPLGALSTTDNSTFVLSVVADANAAADLSASVKLTATLN